MNGKGSHARPMQVTREEYGENWDETFRPKPLLDPTMYAPAWLVAEAEEIARAMSPVTRTPWDDYRDNYDAVFGKRLPPRHRPSNTVHARKHARRQNRR